MQNLKRSRLVTNEANSHVISKKEIGYNLHKKVIFLVISDVASIRKFYDREPSPPPAGQTEIQSAAYLGWEE